MSEEPLIAGAEIDRLMGTPDAPLSERPPVDPLREALILAHDHHSFGPYDCTPDNCSAEAAIQTFATKRGRAGRKMLDVTHGEKRPQRTMELGAPFDGPLADPDILAEIAALASPAAPRPAAPDDRLRDLPERVVVGANGAYWRDYGGHYSMCPVSEDNDPVEVRAVYVRSRITEIEQWVAEEALAAPRSVETAGLDDLHGLPLEDVLRWVFAQYQVIPDEPKVVVLGWAADAAKIVAEKMRKAAAEHVGRSPAAPRPGRAAPRSIAGTRKQSRKGWLSDPLRHPGEGE